MEQNGKVYFLSIEAATSLSVNWTHMNLYDKHITRDLGQADECFMVE